MQRIMSTTSNLAPIERDVVIIGGGQSGLALGYHLASRGRRFTILDAGERVGQVWRNRWDSLRLITPCPYNSLPGLAFPAPRWSFPHKDQVADYLERYARMFALPVRLGQRVHALRRAGQRYRVDTADSALEAPVVVVATGPFQHPRVPDFAAGADLFQIHSSAYRNPGQLPAGDVLVVGCGNSGAGIAQDLAATHRVHLALGRTGTSPRSLAGRDLFWWAHHLGLPRVTIDSRLGRRLRGQPDGLLGVTTQQIAARGVTLSPRVTAMHGSTARFADGASRRFDAVVWATGFRPRYDWIDHDIGAALGARVLDEHGAPVHGRGVSPAPGLYFLGLKWLHCFDSSLLGGVARDAAYLATHIDSYLAGSARPRAHVAGAHLAA